MIYLDSSKLDLLKNYNEMFNLGGATSNPTILKNEDSIHHFYEYVQDALKTLDADQLLHFQTVGASAGEMVDFAVKLHTKINDNRLIIKVPGGSEGLKCIKQLSAKNIRTTATGLYNAMQCICALEAGAEFVVLYVNRMENENIDVSKEMETVRHYIDRRFPDSKILAASFKNLSQISNSFLWGADICTVSPDLLAKTVDNEFTKRDNAVFNADWDSLADYKKDRQF